MLIACVAVLRLLLLLQLPCRWPCRGAWPLSAVGVGVVSVGIGDGVVAGGINGLVFANDRIIAMVRAMLKILLLLVVWFFSFFSLYFFFVLFFT